eukprot:1160456-Pelagomonas_calceolata.AAC.8
MAFMALLASVVLAVESYQQSSAARVKPLPELCALSSKAGLQGAEQIKQPGALTEGLCSASLESFPPL